MDDGNTFALRIVAWLLVVYHRVIVFVWTLLGGMGYDEEDEEISTDLWQEACWIVIR